MIIEDLDDFANAFKPEGSVFISFIGYETRSPFLLQWAHDRGLKDACLWTFENNNNMLALDYNVALVQSMGFELRSVPRTDVKSVLVEILKRIRKLRKLLAGVRVDVHVDYSSMPRDWYCFIISRLWKRKSILLHAWYAAGVYERPEAYPCVGVGKWDVFFSSSRITSHSRATLIGLGFDWVRTNGIIDKLNPEEYYTVAALPDETIGLGRTLRTLNEEIILTSQNFVSLPLSEFSRIFFGLCDLVTHLLYGADVEIVADGPKPLVLAMSLVGVLLGRPGVHCWHVSHASNATMLDVTPRGREHVWGFRLYHEDEQSS